MSSLEAISLLLAACAAGMINAVAGGGTLVTFPVLILFGVSPIIANATSTLSLVVGTAGSIYGFRHQIEEVRPWFKSFIPVSLAGGLLGSILLTYGKESTFAHLVPYLVLFATLLFMLQGFVSRYLIRKLTSAPPPKQGGIHLLIALVFQLLVSVYGGYFGAGIGILMLASLGFLGFSNIHKMNALKNVIGSLINLVAALWFTAHGLINWPVMGVMTLGAVAGYYLGATYSQRLSQEKARLLITSIGVVITAVMFWKLH